MGRYERKWLHGYAKMERLQRNGGIIRIKRVGMHSRCRFISKIDLTSISFEFKKDDKYIVISHSFMPEDTLAEKRKTDKVPYDLWVQQNGSQQHLVQ